jgi:hypothetical protein
MGSIQQNIANNLERINEQFSLTSLQGFRHWPSPTQSFQTRHVWQQSRLKARVR